MSIAILPDKDIEPRIEAEFRALVGATLLTHRSGRPWVLGDEQLVHERGRNVDIVMVGSQLASEDSLTRIAQEDRVGGSSDTARRYVEFDTLLIERDAQKTRRRRASTRPYRSVVLSSGRASTGSSWLLTVNIRWLR